MKSGIWICSGGVPTTYVITMSDTGLINREIEHLTLNSIGTVSNFMYLGRKPVKQVIDKRLSSDSER